LRLFVLQASDPDTGCPVLETRFSVADLAPLCAALGSDAGNDPDLRNHYPLERESLSTHSRLYGLDFDSGGREVTLVPWHRLRELPYLVHTGFELALMLEGRRRAHVSPPKKRR
jgi:hypothetical protein